MNASERVAVLAERAWQHRLHSEPYFQLRNGVEVTRLPARNLQEAGEDAAFGRALCAELTAIDEDELPAGTRLTRAFLVDRMAALADSVELWWSAFPVTPYNASALGIDLQLVFAPFRFASAADADRYLSLMSDHAEALRAAHVRLAMQTQRGWRIPRPALPGVRATLAGLKGAAAAILPVTQARTAALGRTVAASVADRAAGLLEREITPAFDSLLALVGDDYAAAAAEDVGLGRFPGGDDAYRRWLRYHLTLDLDPAAVHQTGLDEVRALTERMREVRAGLAFAGGEAEFVEHLRSSGRLHARSADEVAATYLRHLDHIEPLIPRSFATTPAAPHGVERLDPAAEAGMSYGYYQPPTDEQPRGVYKFNGSGLERRSQLSAAALIFHELVPGHHFHLARQKEDERLPMIRREAIDISVFNEGWAEYASGFAGEMGMYEDPYDLYGRLVHERFVAQRLVVDTGLNALGWSLENARAYMRASTMEADDQVATETLRYSTDLPAQGLAYRIGYLRLMKLREKARSALGSRFDIRDFHEAILGEGALPLPVLEASVDAWVERRRAQ